jgi:glycyl-tRNA synthetase beta chain
MAAADPSDIVRGNERVLRARLADAKFFYDQDRKIRLEARIPGLANVVFHAKLGSQLERVERIERLAVHIAQVLRDIAPTLAVDVSLVERAAKLCKADLLTGMVGEFPELQGVMGMHYALHDREDAVVARAIEAHYRPRFGGDVLPEHEVGACVALADKLDTLAGIWGIGLAPTGDKDPFGLRRAALGVVRILLERSLPLDLDQLLLAANKEYGVSVVPEELRAFILDRLRSYLRERNWTPAEIEAVVSRDSARIDRVVPRLEAVRAFQKLPEAEALAAANKRIHNIIMKSPPAEGDVFSKELLTEAAERDLHTAYEVLMNDEVLASVAKERFADALRALATLKEPVDRFFDQVLVNVEDARLRTNRLLLLKDLDRAMNLVADISKLAR